MITIIDYQMSNLRSVEKAFEKVGSKVKVTSNPEGINYAEKLVLPGVGAFGDAMQNLRKFNLIQPIIQSIQRGIPFLGICLGMQLLFDESEEKGLHTGLSIIPGKVRLFHGPLKVPQIGWNQIRICRTIPILKDIPDQSFFYFVHSYYVATEDPEVIVTTTDYGIEYPSIIAKENTYGIQFHPEKSQDLGLKILENFAMLCS